MQRLMRDIPGIEKVVSRLGRGESPADPAGPNEADVIATLKPIEDRPRDLTQQKIADQMRDRLGTNSRNQSCHVAAHLRSRG